MALCDACGAQAHDMLVGYICGCGNGTFRAVQIRAGAGGGGAGGGAGNAGAVVPGGGGQGGTGGAASHMPAVSEVPITTGSASHPASSAASAYAAGVRAACDAIALAKYDAEKYGQPWVLGDAEIPPWKP